MTVSPATCDIRYGDEVHRLVMPRGVPAARMEPAHVEVPGSAPEILGRALASPAGSPRLRDLACGKRSAAILVPGKDRVAAIDACLPLLMEELNAAGIPDDRIDVYLATGTHEKHSADDAARVLGAEAVRRLRRHEHDCRDAGALGFLGTTRLGTEVFMNRAVLDAEVKVLTGRIIPHYFAGWSGGRKALLPGVAGLRTILQNHRLTLDSAQGIHPDVRPCSLERNPVHEDMAEAAGLAGPVFVLNTLLDTGHRMIGAVAGDLTQAHLAGCREAEAIFKVAAAEPLDAVVTSAGGSPYDCNFMQALKAAFNVQEVVRPGGAILWVARCPGGMARGFTRWGSIGSDEQLNCDVRANYDLTGHNSIMLRRLVRKVRVALWSDLADEDVRTVGLEPVHSLEEGVAWLMETCPGNFRYGVAPFANVTYATSAGDGAKRTR
jgi:lactate racemase